MPLALAFAISALLHAAAIVAPGWDLPGMTEPEPTTIDAHLLPPPRATPPAPRPEKPRPRAQPARKAVAAAPVDNTASPREMPVQPAESRPTVAPPTPEPPAVAEPPAAAPPPAPPWPRRGRLRYTVTYGDDNLVVGATTHEWRVDGAHYTIRALAEPKGLAALFGKQRVQSSEGEITAEGLRPGEFRDQREGRAQESATFDWPALRAVFSGGRGEGRLAAGAQDLLSVFYQLAWAAPHQDVVATVATASRVGRWTFAWVGEEELQLAGRTLVTLHWRTRADGDSTEVWLAPAHGGLPVKIRHTGRKGDVFEQTAELLELD